MRTYPDIVAEAKKHKARIYFIDEAAFRSDSHRGTTWGKIAQTPVVKDSGGCFNFKLVSAVSARGDMYFDVIEERMNSDKFIDFLKNYVGMLVTPYLSLRIMPTITTVKRFRSFSIRKSNREIS